MLQSAYLFSVLVIPAMHLGRCRVDVKHGMLGGIALWNVLTGIVTSESGRELFRHAEEESSGLRRGVLEALLDVF